MALREIRTDRDPVLRMRCRVVDAVDGRVRQLLDDMVETMYHTGNGAGLAACQVGVLRRLVVIDMGTGLLKLVNPRIVEKRGRQMCEEGCLSFPGRWEKTLRPASVTVRALDENGREIEIQGSGDMAKCLCHEIDHLDGILFFDHKIQ